MGLWLSLIRCPGLTHTTSKCYTVCIEDKHMKPSEVLKKAAERIRNHEERYICFAIKTVCGFYKAFTPGWRGFYREHRAAMETTLGHIRNLLGNHTSLEHWLAERFPEHKDNLIKHRDWVNQPLRETRLAWIDDMIRYFEGKGQ